MHMQGTLSLHSDQRHVGAVDWMANGFTLGTQSRAVPSGNPTVEPALLAHMAHMAHIHNPCTCARACTCAYTRTRTCLRL